MDSYKQRLINQHAALVVAIDSLSIDVYGSKNEVDDKIEFANRALQLSAMKQYEKALYARMNNAGIYFKNGTYFEKVGNICNIAMGIDNVRDVNLSDCKTANDIEPYESIKHEAKE